MAKNDYPNTQLQPLQQLDFLLASGDLVRAILNPIPDSTRTKVMHVDLKLAAAGSIQLTRLGNAQTSRTVTQAGIEAYQFAQHESKRVNAPIIEACLQGEEFLEKTDVEQITGNSFPVTVV